MASQQRAISVSEFFAKNRHLLGFDNKRKALLTSVKEAVDNSLDACEEAGILPEVHVAVDRLAEDRYRVTVRDNGPGIAHRQMPNIFGKLLYGSKFHRLKMSRGQQGIGISAAGMYGLITTGKPVRVVSRTGPHSAGHAMELAINTKINGPEVLSDRPADVVWFHGTEVSIEMVASHGKGRQSVEEYLSLTAIANPHVRISWRGPDGELVVFERTVEELPAESRAIKPHPHGIELGTMMKMLREAKGRVGAFLCSEFCRVGEPTAARVCGAAKVDPRTPLRGIGPDAAGRLYAALQEAKLRAPPKNCLVPIGAEALLAGMLGGVKAEFYTASVRPPAVYRGNPFQVEVALAWGGQLATDEPARVMRFANRVPLLYRPGSCCMHKAVCETGWRGYGLQQPKGHLPVGPLVILVHIASVWVPYTSEGKEGIADYDEIRKEIRLALAECGRRLGRLLRRKKRRSRHRRRRDVFTRYIGEVVGALHSILPDMDSEAVRDQLAGMARDHTERADEEYDDHGRTVVQGGLGPDTILVEDV